MTRLDFKYTNNSELLHDVVRVFPDLPVVAVAVNSCKKGRPVSIADVVVERVCKYPRDEDTLLVESRDIQHFADLERLHIISLGDMITDEYAIKALSTSELESSYFNLQWENAIVIYIGD